MQRRKSKTSFCSCPFPKVNKWSKTKEWGSEECRTNMTTCSREIILLKISSDYCIVPFPMVKLKTHSQMCQSEVTVLI